MMKRATRSRMRAGARLCTSVALLLGAAAAVATPASAQWTYERVTPVDKDGGSIRVGDTFRAAPDGSGLLYSSTGSFSGVPAASGPQYVRYLAQRGETGWTNAAVDPPWDMGNLTLTIMLTVGSSENLEWLVLTSTLALTPGAHAGGSNLYVRNTRTGRLYLAATTPNRSDFTDGLSSSLGATAVKFVGNDGLVLFGTFGGAELMPTEAPGATAYRWTPQTGLEALGRKPAAEGAGYAAGGSGHSSGETGVLNPIPASAAGQRTYFRATANGAIYMLGATGAMPMTPVTRDRTAANLGAMRSGYIAGTSEDGRYLVLQLSTAGQKLTDDTPTLPGSPRYIYRYDSVTDALELVGAASNAQLNTIGSGVRWVSRDAKTVLYQSSAVHASGAVDGQPNLYVWRENEGIKLIAVTGDIGGATWRAASRNGRYVGFTSVSQSLAQQFGYDNLSVGCSTTASPAPCRLVYRYDIEEERLDCVSCRPDGNAPDADAGAALVPSPGFMRMDTRLPQFVADDGTVFFDSRDPLVASDLNGEFDTYAWRDGDLRLVSRAKPGSLSRFIDATPDGRTVFFATADRIVPSDTDRSFDIYAARLDGGLVEEPDGGPVPCTGSDCRVPAVAGGPALPQPSQRVLPQDVPRPSDAVKKSRVRIVSVRRQGRYARVVVQPSGDGTIRFSGKGLVRTERSARGSQAFTVRVRLAKRTLRQVRKRGSKVRIKMSVRYTPAFGKAAKTQRRLTVKGR